MRNYAFWIAFLFCLNLACKQRDYVQTGDIKAPTEAQTDSAKQEREAEEQHIVNSTPPEMVKEVEKIKEEKEDSSPFRREGCCSNEPPPALCCCDAVWVAYLELFNSEEAVKLAKIRAEDPILNDCYKMIPSFKKKVDELEM